MWFGIGFGVWLAVSMVLLGIMGDDDIENVYASVLWPVYAAVVPFFFAGQWIGRRLRKRD